LRATGAVLAYLAVSYWLTGWFFSRVLSTVPGFNFYVLQPVLWAGLGVIAYWSWRRLADRPPFSRLFTGIAVFVGLFHVGILVMAGLVLGMGDSPVTRSLLNYPRNGLYIVTLLLGIETARGFLYETWRRHDELIAFAATTVLFFAISVPASQWTLIGEADRFARIVGGRWLPALALSALATWLVHVGGLGPSLGYRFVLLSFEWFSPVLPDLGWLALLVVGVATPAIAATLARNIYADTVEAERRGFWVDVESGRSDESEAVPEEDSASRRWVGLAGTAVVSILLLLFLTGAFGVQPSIVSGISMEPGYERGDIAIIREGVDTDTLQVNDVVRVRSGGIDIVHRIIAIDETPTGRVFTTKGDNVARPDPPVAAVKVDGKVVFLIPEVGRLALWLRGA
jgi:signal peptidase